MPQKIPTASARRIQDAMVAATPWPTAKMHLFQNNHVPSNGDTVADYTEANYDGYASQTLGAPGAAATVGGRSTITWPALTFTKAAGVATNLIYGYYITNAAGDLLAAELDPNGPVPFLVAGATYVITYVNTYVSEF